jgi:hypothetical protein
MKGKFSKPKSHIYQRFNLKQLLGEEPTSEQKELFASLVNDAIVNRTLDGNDVNGKTFERYSEQYAEKKGVTRDSVNLFLAGGMLDDIKRDAAKESVNTVVVAIKNREQILKAANHDNGDTLPRREFFGVTQKKAEELASRIAKNDDSSLLSDVLASAAASEATQTTNLRDLLSSNDFIFDSSGGLSGENNN